MVYLFGKGRSFQIIYEQKINVLPQNVQSEKSKLQKMGKHVL